MLRFLIVSVIVAGIATGCGSANASQSQTEAPTARQAAPATFTPAPTPVPNSVNPAVTVPVTGTVRPAATVRGATPAPAKTNATLTLKVTTPLDESIVSVASIVVAGQTIPGAVVSVDGNLVDVDASGKFQTTVRLDQGPNVIEVVASDDSGNEVSTILSLVYEP